MEKREAVFTLIIWNDVKDTVSIHDLGLLIYKCSRMQYLDVVQPNANSSFHERNFGHLIMQCN